ncbi:hypothetical protein D3C85_1701570 [compost metagenome]
MKYLITLDQPTIIAGIDPAQSFHRQRHARKVLAGPAATGTARASEDHQGSAPQVEQEVIGVEVGQLLLGH